MADYTQPEYVDRRLRYFDGQFLREQDFIDEQRYHLDRERRLARVAHTAGVVEGLAVAAVPNAPKVTIAAGTALDGHGRLLVRADAGDPLDLTDLVNRDDPVTVLVALAYAEVEADAPQGGASPRWQEAPRVLRFLEGDATAPPEDDAPRLARVVLGKDGTAAVDQTWAAGPSGIGVRGRLSVTGPASFPGGVDGGPGTDGAVPLRIRGDLRTTGPAAFDSTVRLDVVNGSADFGRANIVITGRIQAGNDAWNFGTGARNSLVFASNAAASGQSIGAVGDEQASLQLEGNSRSLGILTRDRGAEPALTVAQDGTVQVGTAQRGGSLAVVGNLGAGEIGQWSVQVLGQGASVMFTIAPGSRRNVMVFRLTDNRPVYSFQVVVPQGTEGQWLGRFMYFDPLDQTAGPLTKLLQGTPLSGSLNGLPPDVKPTAVYLEVHQVTTLEA